MNYFYDVSEVIFSFSNFFIPHHFSSDGNTRFLNEPRWLKNIFIMGDFSISANYPISLSIFRPHYFGIARKNTISIETTLKFFMELGKLSRAQKYILMMKLKSKTLRDLNMNLTQYLLKLRVLNH